MRNRVTIGNNQSPVGKPIKEFLSGDIVEITKSGYQGEIGYIAMVTDTGYVWLHSGDAWGDGDGREDNLLDVFAVRIDNAITITPDEDGE